MNKTNLTLKDISFDEEDEKLFLADDPRLRADALKHSILPKLNVIIHECLTMIRNIYEIEALEHSIITQYPNFRSKRDSQLDRFYEDSYVGLGGQRKKGKWKGVKRKDGKHVQIIPFRYGIHFNESGFNITLDNYWLKGLDKSSFRKLFDFYLEHESIIFSLCHHLSISPIYEYDHKKGPITELKESIAFVLNSGRYDFGFITDFDYIIKSTEDLYHLCKIFVCFFPMYDAYIQIALGKNSRFIQLIEQLNAFLVKEPFWDKIEYTSVIAKEYDSAKADKLTDVDKQKAREAAEEKTRVMPAIRWQTFERDKWKCVACGRSAKDGIILHVDHIIPRSKGGKNSLKNYQTLCHECNIGKSNKSSTDLRSTKK